MYENVSLVDENYLFQRTVNASARFNLERGDAFERQQVISVPSIFGPSLLRAIEILEEKTLVFLPKNLLFPYHAGGKSEEHR